MSLTLAQRANFYHELGNLYDAGFTLLQAIETMLDSRGTAGLRRVLDRLRAAALDGDNLTECLSGPGLPFEQMEISLLAACEHSGQLPQGCQWLSNYFARLDQTRRAIWKKALYPLFLLHFGVIILALPKIFQEGNKFSLLNDIIVPLGAFYLFGATLWTVARTMNNLARDSAFYDRMLSRLPLFGGIRRSLALTRFCSGYLMQLNAGVNVMDCLSAAAAASHSATLRAAVEKALPGIRQGGEVALNLSLTRAFPPLLTRALQVGEQTGNLDKELARAATQYDLESVGRIETLSEWIPRMIYLAIVLYLGWSIIDTFKKSMSGLEEIMKM